MHALAAPAEDEPLESEVDERSGTLDLDLTARFATALTELVTALTAFFTALLGELLIARKLPLARDTSANPTARDKTPSQIRHFLRAPAESTNFLERDDPEDT